MKTTPEQTKDKAESRVAANHEEKTKAQKKKDPKERKTRLVVRFSALKTDTKDGKKLLEDKGQKSLVYRTIADAKRPVRFAEVLDEIKKPFGSVRAESVTPNLRWYVSRLKRDGYLKATVTIEQAE